MRQTLFEIRGKESDVPGRLLSKSRYMNGLQCHRLLWYIFNDPEKVPDPDVATRYIFDQGHLVGELAKKLYPDGIDIPDEDYRSNLSLTKKYLELNKPLFEAGIQAGNLFSRIDILKPAGRGLWDIIEVKSSTSLKEENLHDVSFQKYCAEKQGLTVNKCYLVYINNQYVRHGELDPFQLFTIEDITGQVKEAGEGIEDRIASMFATISSGECPDTPVGEHCRRPYDCPVTCCWEELPENNIFSLYRGGKKCFDLFHSGVYYVKDIPDNYKLTRSQQIQKWCEVNDSPYIERGALREFLDSLRYPVHYLDFETINPALPLFDGVRPYQQVPFQFSLHIADGTGRKRHFSFLADGPGDPRPAFLEELVKKIKPSGSVVTYKQSFEEGILTGLGEAFPDYAEWTASICNRMVDLLKPFQNFHYYHPGQNGSASIKSVLPVLTGRSYEDMEIGEGEAASRAFLYVTYGGASEEERRQVRAALEEYCSLDTEGMSLIVDKLKEICNQASEI